MCGEVTLPCPRRKHRAGVDIHSCSQFLLELYSRWVLPSSSARRTPVILISEVVRSVSLPRPPSLSCVHITPVSTCVSGNLRGNSQSHSVTNCISQASGSVGECHAAVRV